MDIVSLVVSVPSQSRMSCTGVVRHRPLGCIEAVDIGCVALVSNVLKMFHLMSWELAKSDGIATAVSFFHQLGQVSTAISTPSLPHSPYNIGWHDVASMLETVTW